MGISLGSAYIEVPRSLEPELRNVIESESDSENGVHPFEEMNEDDLRFKIADALGIGPELVYISPQIHIRPRG